MRICFFTGSMQLGGIGKLTLNLIEEFLKKDIQVDLFLLKDGGEYIDQVPEEVRIFVTEGSSIKQIYKFITYLNRERPDISISARQRQDLVNICCCCFSLSKTKPVVSIHTNLTEEYRRLEKKRKIFPVISKLLYKIPQKFIAVSGGVADDFSQRTGIGREKIKVIYNPVYTPYKNIFQDSISSKYEELKRQNKRFIIAAGRFTEQKDFFTLIKAFSFVKEQMDISLVLLGDGPLRADIEDLIRSLSLTEHILLMGYVDNPEYYIRDASVFVLSSKWEGFGNVLVEAMGVGIPVVSTDCPSGPAEILDNGRYGELVPVAAPKEMAQAIIRTLEEPINPECLKQRARDFAAPKIAEEYLEYLSLRTT